MKNEKNISVNEFLKSIKKLDGKSQKIGQKFIDKCPACLHLFEYKNRAEKKVCSCGKSNADITEFYIRISFNGSFKEYQNLTSK